MSSKKFFSKVTEPIDQWLELQGLYRKHTAHDPSCLFRAVAEQVYFSQCCHEIVRKRCVSFIAQNKDQYEKMIDGPMENYLSKLSSPKEWGSKLELNALSFLYQREIIVFEQGEKPTRISINNVFGKCIMLCSSSDNHYDSVYPKSYITKAAFCQSIVYGVLYKRVFGLVDVDFAVDKMLHKSNHNKREHYVQQNYICASRSMGLPVELPMKTIRHLEPDRFEEELNVKELLSRGITPFPYKVAKALDPDIYRNIEFDVWSDLRREMKLGIVAGNGDELQIGVKCLVKMHPDHHFHAHIQEMEPNNGPVIVFVEELGKMCTVSHDVLEPLPKNQKVQWSVPYKQQRHLTALSPKSHFLTLTELNSKWRKNKYNKSRKLKDLFMPSLSSNSTSHPSSFHQEPSITSIHYPMDHFNYNSNDSVASSEECSNESSQMMQSDNAVGGGTLVAPSADSTSSPASAALGDSDQTLNNNCSPPLQIVGVPMYHSFCPDSSGVRVSPSPGPAMPSYVLCSGNPQGRLHPVAASVDNFTMQPVNFYAQKSVHINGSDLPFSDISTLRFYYNLGHDHFRSCCMMWPSAGSSCSSPVSAPVGENNSQLLPDSTVPSEDDSCHVQKTVQTVPALTNQQHTMRHGVSHAVPHSVPMTTQVVPQISSQVTAPGILPNILPQMVPVSPSAQHPVSHPPSQKLLQQPIPSPQHAVCSVIPQSPSPSVQQPVFGVNNNWQNQPTSYVNSPQRVHQTDCDSRSNSHSSHEDSCARGTDTKNVNSSHASVAVHPTVTDSFAHSQIFPYYVVEMDSVPYYNPYSYVMQQSSDIDITNSMTNVQMHTLQPQNMTSMPQVLYHSQSVSHGTPIPHWISSDGVSQYAVTL